MKQPAKTSKGPGPVRDGLGEIQNRVYCGVQFCKWAQHAKECLAAARGEVSPTAERLRELARSYGQAARGYYAAAMGMEGAV